MVFKQLLTGSLLIAASASAWSTPFTSTSPSGFDVTTVGASTVGGIVVDLVGLNDARVISQLSASSLYVGFYDSGTPAAYQGNPGTIGIQSGFGDAVTGALGGGLKSAAFRFTLYDGDTASGDFDENDNTLLVNNTNLGDWTAVNAQNTDGSGNPGASGLSGGGFRDSLLDTGWFYSTNAAALASLFAAIDAADSLTFQVNDIDPYDNFYDFTQGLDASVINVGQGPGIIPGGDGGSVPEPGILGLLGAGLALTWFSRKRSKIR